MPDPDDVVRRHRELSRPLEPHEVEDVLARLRVGETVVEGTSSDHSRWSFRDGGFVEDGFDQGRRWTTHRSEAEMRAAIAAMPRPFRAVVR
jgi:hypothetical protein